jgi:ligand-binding sensor domain-containing protein
MIQSPPKYTFRILLFILVWFYAPLHPCSAQGPGYKNFVLEEDNKRVKINTISTTSDGYIYAGTVNGLYKFDGENFKKIYFLNKDYNDTVTAIFQDHQKKIWIGFFSGRLAHVINGEVVFYNPEEGTPQKKITAILQDKEQNIWYASYGEGLYYIKNNRHYLINAADGLSDVNVSSLALTQQGDVLAATDQGINVISLKNNKKSIRVIGPAEGLPDYIVTQISAAGNHRFWISLQDKGFCLYDDSSKKIILPEVVSNWNYGQVNAVLQDGNILWIATQQAGVFQYSLTSQKLVAVPASAAHISQLLRDKQGNIWMAGPDNGLSRSPGNAIRLFTLYPPAFFETIHTLLYDSHGNIWVNDDMALIRFSPQQEGFVSKKFPIAGLDFATDITALYEDIYQHIWIGTMGKGIYVFNPSTGQMRHLDENAVFKNASLLSLSGKDSTIFVCSMQGASSITLSGENKNINAPYSFKGVHNINTGSNYIYSIFKDKKNRVWYGTDGMGLMMEENGQFNYYNDEKLLKDRHIYSITEDNEGNTWFSTASAGIYRFDGKTFTNYGLKEGLSNLDISVIKKINSGHIVIVHKKGLDVMDPVSSQLTYLNSNTGLGTVNADNLGAVTTDPEGNILVTTIDGIVSFTLPAGASLKPFTIIESVQLFLKEIDTASTHLYKYDENNISFYYTGLYYNDPAHVYYQYKLEGLDSNWIITKDRNKTFSKLEPGKYLFRIQSSLSKNFKNAQEASYRFEILKPFYKTNWFFISSILLITGLLYWYIQSREKELKKIQQLNQEKMQFQFEVLRNQVNPHFLFNSFNTLISSIEDNPKMAVQYAELLSDFFRNIVTYRDKEIIPLKEEMSLLQTYFSLQQKRFGDNLQMKVQLTEDDLQKFHIPPLTLQLLVENAIKHNIVSTEYPLTIIISMEDQGNLYVSNNKNKRSSMAAGAGMGLQNIKGRFKILTGKAIHITDEEKYFIVKLPLITNQDNHA